VLREASDLNGTSSRAAVELQGASDQDGGIASVKLRDLQN